MAVMHPVDIENYDYTPTEKDLYYALKSNFQTSIRLFILFAGLKLLKIRESTAKAIFWFLIRLLGLLL